MTYKQEVFRKAIHFFSLVIPIGYLLVSKVTALYILIPISFVFISVDIARLCCNFVKKLFYNVFSLVVRDHEKHHLTGSSYLMAGSVVVVMFFPKSNAIFSLLLLAISDSAAALVGKRIGKHKLFNKSFEGTIAFIGSALSIALFFSTIPLMHKIVASVSAAVVEVLPLKIDDNFTIPVSTCTILWLVSFL